MPQFIKRNKPDSKPFEAIQNGIDNQFDILKLIGFVPAAKEFEKHWIFKIKDSVFVISDADFLKKYQPVHKPIPVKKQWYEDENLLKKGVLCWCWDYEEKTKKISIVFDYKVKLTYKFRVSDGCGVIGGCGFINAIPLSDSEIEALKRGF